MYETKIMQKCTCKWYSAFLSLSMLAGFAYTVKLNFLSVLFAGICTVFIALPFLLFILNTIRSLVKNKNEASEHNKELTIIA